VGFDYVYLIKTTLYTCFYISLQPIIVVMAIIGIILYFLAAKYALYFWCQRPKPSSSFLYNILNRILLLSFLAYVIGNITWTYIACVS